MTSLLFPVEASSLDLSNDLRRGADLASQQGSSMDPRQIFETLNAAKLKAVLVGAHAINARSGRPRATLDVDLIGEKPRQVADALQAAFSNLTLESHAVVFRLKLGGKEAIDVIRPESSPIFKAVLNHTEQVKIEQTSVTIPSVEATLALKFASMTSITRRIEDRYTDGRDFILVAQLGGDLDQKILSKLGEAAFPGGGAELLDQVDAARAGKPLKL